MRKRICPALDELMARRENSAGARLGEQRSREVAEHSRRREMIASQMQPYLGSPDIAKSFPPPGAHFIPDDLEAALRNIGIVRPASGGCGN
jgi:hypothetical protein